MKIFFSFLAGVNFAGVIATAANGHAWMALFTLCVTQLCLLLAWKSE